MAMEWGRCGDVYALGEVTTPPGTRSPWILRPVAVVAKNGGPCGPGWRGVICTGRPAPAEVFEYLDSAMEWAEEQLRDV